MEHSKPKYDKHGDLSFKVIMCGNVCVGQTSLLQRFAGNYVDNPFASITFDLIFRRVVINCERCFLQIYEIAGRTPPFLLTPYFRSATGIIFTFSIDDERSFESVRERYAIMTCARSLFFFLCCTPAVALTVFAKFHSFCCSLLLF
jgi:GTPase SAR1 family protein